MILSLLSFLFFILTFLLFRKSKEVGVIFFILIIALILLLELQLIDIILLVLIASIAYTSIDLFFRYFRSTADSSSLEDTQTAIDYKSKKTYRVKLETTSWFSHFIKDVRLGVSITGASGSGKTESPCYALALHYSKYEFSGIIHDFKDFELTEIIYPLFKNTSVKFHIFSPLHPEYSVRINPIDPHYISTPMQLTPLVQSFVLNLTGKSTTNEAAVYFAEGATSLITAVIWRFKESFPDYCNWSYIIAFLLMGNHTTDPEVPYNNLINFIKISPEAAILGSMFLLSQANEREIGSLMGTMSSSLKKIADPTLFYLLSKNDLNLDINSDENRAIISFVNTPGVEQNAITPILASMIEVCFQNMSIRNRKPSFVLLDEAPRIKIMNLGARVATLRSYGVSFCYIMQDAINQAKSTYDGKDYYVKEIISNLSTQIFGKANDPESAKYYESFFPFVKEKTTSISSAAFDLMGTDQRTSVGSKDKRKVLAHAFLELKQGCFFILSGGKEKKIQFKNYSKTMKKELPPVVDKDLDYKKIKDLYINIIETSKNKFYN